MIRYLSVVALLSVSLVACATSESNEPAEGEAEQLLEKEAFTDIKKACMVTGCSGQVCADQPVNTTCEWRSEYACYAEARCEQQENGACGWTRTPELEACLGNKI